ncbi:hypothetical protein H6F93_02300 [Leptolyngbya sp. FACHB-671]|uniref:hypothetical protein n=1 Tax=Leptolyngbya sp. FACHB-671 TaxID=2692812 RepID=UPI001684855F|nr:hypothetical protein [Leptolyngbya sp. FACHB-671]MBD2066367.1 hypothetical protein [Leptolyngbya sp. FACHB-671]
MQQRLSDMTIKKGASIVVCNAEAWFRTEILEIQLNDETVETVSEGEVGIKLRHSVFKTSELWLEDSR